MRLTNKYVKSFDAKGVKVHPSTGWRLDDPKMAPFFDLTDDLGLVTHAGAGRGPLNDELARPEPFQEVMSKRESMRLVVAHLGGKYRDELYRLASRNPNVYADCSALQGWLPLAAGDGRGPAEGGVRADAGTGLVRLGLAIVRSGLLSVQLGGVRSGKEVGDRRGKRETTFR